MNKPKSISTEELLAEWAELSKSDRIPEGWVTVNQLAALSNKSAIRVRDEVRIFSSKNPQFAKSVLYEHRRQKAVDARRFIDWSKARKREMGI